MDVATLVAQMNETLSAIHSTIGGLSTAEHDARLDDLEQKRDGTLAALRANFERERDELAAHRKLEREEIAERRRREDEEIAARRKREDEELASRCYREDDKRHDKLQGETRDVEDEMDELMEGIESEAHKMIEAGREKLAQLEAKRRVNYPPPAGPMDRADMITGTQQLDRRTAQHAPSGSAGPEKGTVEGCDPGYHK